MRKTGFTMIEFLVVAALIGILATLGLGAYTKSLSRGRDAKRIEDMKQIQKGFELYYSIHNQYTTCETMFGDDQVFPQDKPEPPAGNIAYFGECDDDSYAYCAALENGKDYGNKVCPSGSINSEGSCGLTPASVNDSFCVYSVQ